VGDFFCRDYECGIEGYCAPERVRNGEPFTKCADIWALGCLIYELAALQLAFDSDWTVGEYFSCSSALQPSVPQVPEFLHHQLNESLLNKTASLRPTANEVRITFGLYCQLLQLPIFGFILNLRSSIPYSKWKQLAVEPFSVRTTLLWIAGVYEEMGEIQVAAAVRRELVALDLKEVVAKNNERMDLNESNLNESNHRPATRNLKRAIKDVPHDVSLWHDLCQTSIRNGEVDQAITFCMKEIKRLHSNPLPSFAMSYLYAWKGDYHTAISSFVTHFDSDDVSLPTYNTSVSTSNLVKIRTLKSLASAWASGDPSPPVNMALHWAAWTGNMVAVDRLIQNCAESPALHVDKSGLTPLHLSAWNMHTELGIQLLEKYPMWAGARDEKGWTPLHVAAVNGDVKLISMLLKAKADPEAQTDEGTRPIHWAVEGGYVDAINELRTSEVDISAKDHEGGTPLHWAAAYMYNGVGAITELAKAGVDVRATDKKGKTPLHWAVEQRHWPAITHLVSLGADVSCRAKDGTTLMDLAFPSNDPHFIRALSDLCSKTLTEDGHDISTKQPRGLNRSRNPRMPESENIDNGREKKRKTRDK
jgi:ankyrin repeat protein